MEAKHCSGTYNGLIDSVLEFDYLLLEVIWSLRVIQRECLWVRCLSKGGNGLCESHSEDASKRCLLEVAVVIGKHDAEDPIAME